MSIIFTKGDLLQQNDVDAIVNTVNCVGVMGKGIALQFKKKWPGNFKEYATACKDNIIKIGKMHVYETDNMFLPKYIINFPTKNHWKEKSKIKYIQEGLDDLIIQIKKYHINSIAIPPLGCGNGGLNWQEIKLLIEEKFKQLPEVKVILFEPNEKFYTRDFVPLQTRPKMTTGRASILKLTELYKLKNYAISNLEIQKLAYFLQISGINLKLNFEKHLYGPYADALRHALIRLNGHFITGVNNKVMCSEIEPIQDALVEADNYINELGDKEFNFNLSRVSDLIEGYQTPYGMELLSTVHWVAVQENAQNADDAYLKIQNWNNRKKQIIQKSHVNIVWQHLIDCKWI